uniref:Uncharacterized protein n=1 Tax=Anguilla anguilla TaxID=7936 RepID=A0A0E9T834_ANGAN
MSLQLLQPSSCSYEVGVGDEL